MVENARRQRCQLGVRANDVGSGATTAVDNAHAAGTNTGAGPELYDVVVIPADTVVRPRDVGYPTMPRKPEHVPYVRPPRQPIARHSARHLGAEPSPDRSGWDGSAPGASVTTRSTWR